MMGDPQIYGVYDDNSITIDPDDWKKNSLGLCTTNIRPIVDTPEDNWIKLLIRLTDKSLYVAYDTGTESDWITCFQATVPIDDTGSGYYLGLTAETGIEYADSHYVKSLSAWR